MVQHFPGVAVVVDPTLKGTRRRAPATQTQRHVRSTGRGFLLLLTGVAAVALGRPDPTHAQGQSRPFSTLSLFGGPAVDAEVGNLDDFWNARHGYLLRLSTPFYLGSATAGFQDASFGARSLEQPDFHMRTFTIEWSAGADLPAGAHGFAGVHAGAAAMHFLEREVTFNGDENEFLLGAQGGVGVPLTSRLSVTALGGHRKVFTRIPLRMTFASLGLSYTVRTPAALREVLE